ncbi:hypothetical protein [Paraburkholderia panacisoli]|nr:hypothetical protein [Paraburkholderia panacisoli]
MHIELLHKFGQRPLEPGFPARAEHAMCLLSAMAVRPANFADCKWWALAADTSRSVCAPPTCSQGFTISRRASTAQVLTLEGSPEPSISVGTLVAFECCANKEVTNMSVFLAKVSLKPPRRTLIIAAAAVCLAAVCGTGIAAFVGVLPQSEHIAVAVTATPLLDIQVDRAVQ